MPETDSTQYPHIYRAVTKKRWYDDSSRRVLWLAFRLRPREISLSVLKTIGCSLEACLAGQRDCFGEFVLETNRVRGLGLGVIDDEPDAPDFSPSHAEINQIPINPTTDEEIRRAEDLATDLADLSSLYYDRYDSYA